MSWRISAPLSSSDSHLNTLPFGGSKIGTEGTPPTYINGVNTSFIYFVYINTGQYRITIATLIIISRMQQSTHTWKWQGETFRMDCTNIRSESTIQYYTVADNLTRGHQTKCWSTQMKHLKMEDEAFWVKTRYESDRIAGGGTCVHVTCIHL